ncbi:MAG: hypothetical protein EXQ59_03825 [Acidobacteria bacterium]|nr:hypothetical protein [Acidobacteriota bacterium]
MTLMHFGHPSAARRACFVLALACVVVTSACAGRGVFKAEYEYEEELYLALDGSATLNVNASVASLVALRGFTLDPSPRARLDRAAVRTLFEGPGADVSKVSLSRRDGRRFVHVSVDVNDVRRLRTLAPFAWSSYRFDRRGDVMEFRQAIGPPTGRPVSVGWTGQELVAFRMHLPSEIPFHNSPGSVQRGNILEWEQPLADRLKGAPLDLQVQLEPESILHTTLLLFGSMVVAAAVTFALLIWWVARRGRHGEMAESRS